MVELSPTLTARELCPAGRTVNHWAGLFAVSIAVTEPKMWIGRGNAISTTVAVAGVPVASRTTWEPTTNDVIVVAVPPR